MVISRVLHLCFCLLFVSLGSSLLERSFATPGLNLRFRPSVAHPVNLQLRGGGDGAHEEHHDLNNRTVYDFDFDEVFEANREWAKHKRETDPGFFDALAKAQHPKILWIGCSDARVPANVIMGADPGVVFVQRNIANQVLSTDANVQAVIQVDSQYAVDVLQVPHIVVCGHYCCGGIAASMQNVNHGSPLENWLRNIRDVHRIHHKELEAIENPEARLRRLVELNVVEQCLNLYKTASVQRRRFETKRDTGKAVPTIHGLVYDLAHGELLPVKTDVGMEFSKMQEMYELYDFDPVDRETAIRVTSVPRD